MSKKGKLKLFDWARMGRGFDSARQRHQHIESTMTTGFTQNISPKAANTAQSSLITPQFAEKTTKERLKKITSSRARHHLSLIHI